MSDNGVVEIRDQAVPYQGNSNIAGGAGSAQADAEANKNSARYERVVIDIA